MSDPCLPDKEALQAKLREVTDIALEQADEQTVYLTLGETRSVIEFTEERMGDFTVEEMLAMQQALQEKYKDKWEPIGPEAGKHKLLWMLGEVGEVIDIIKKNGDKTVVEDAAIRQHLVEEMADVLMYYNDVLLCYGISEQELKEAYTAKFEKNMTRW